MQKQRSDMRMVASDLVLWCVERGIYEPDAIEIAQVVRAEESVGEDEVVLITGTEIYIAKK